MITTYIGLSIRIWIFAGDPDNNVRTAGGSYADIGEWFMNTTNGALFACTNNISGSQTWQSTTNASLVQALIASTILQSDWSQSNSSLQDFIKNKPSIPAAQVNSDWNAVSGLSQILNKPQIPASQIQSDWTQTNNSLPDYIKNKPADLSQSSVSRSLNTVFQINSTRWASVRYSIDVSTTVSLSGSQVGTVILEMATNSNFTTGVQTIQQFSNGNTGTLVVGLVLTQLNTACLSGNIPPGNYVRIRTVNVTGSPTFTYQTGQEVLL